MDKICYLDNNATTPIDPEVYNSILPYLQNIYFNPSSLYDSAKDSRYALEAARRQMAQLLGMKSDSELIFTGNASESNNAALKGVLHANPSRKHIITSAVEHPAILETCKDLERQGYQVTYLGVDENGELEVKELINAIREDTAIVSIMHANNETGIIYPIGKLSKIVKLTDPQIVFHTDATQTVGKMNINLQNDYPYVDMLSFSGHKIYAPKGIGALYCKAGTRWRSFIVGGHQERGRRAGTENVAFAVGMATALQRSIDNLNSEHQKIRVWRDQLEEFISKNIPAIRINGKNAPRLDSTSNISFEAIEGESIIYALNEYKICASTGSACSSGSLAPSHVLQAMKIPFSYAHGTIRFSFGRFNTQEDLNHLLTVLPQVIAKLRQISPFWDQKKNCATDFTMPKN